jgi:hypothetical protein
MALAIAAAALIAPGAHSAGAQGGRGGRGAAPSPRAAAPIDLTGYWVSVVTEDWLWRMVTPKKGDVASVPLNAEGRRVANQWDPARDEASGERCRPFGAAGLLRLPGRLRLTWESDTVLRLDADAGTQTRLFHFGGGPASGGPPTWQGHSAAQWEFPAGRGGGTTRLEGAPTPGGALKVVTTRMRPGYLRKNGVPYSANAVLTEYFHRFNLDGDSWLLVITRVEDPQYLNEPFITSTHFKQVPDASGWNPTPCSTK